MNPFTLSAGLKIVFWFLFVIFLPVLTLFFVKRTIEMESNYATFFLLAGYTLVDMAMAWILTGLQMPGFWRGLLILSAGVAAGFFNIHAFAWIKKYGS